MYLVSFFMRRTCGIVIAAGLLLAACTTAGVYVRDPGEDAGAVPPQEAPSYRLFLIGGAGAAPAEAPVLELLQAHLAETGANGAVVFLGDNTGPGGLPDSTHAARPAAEARLRAQLRAVRDFPGRVLFIPGDHDWNHGGTDGRAALARQEAFVEAYLGRDDAFLPDDGFPGPVPVELADGITLIALDTQWWLAREKPFGDTGAYDLEDPGDFLLEFRDLLFRRRKDHLVVVGHHPLFSNGRHAGYAPWREHLTPLPLLGSVGPLYRRFIGREQDLAHARYRLFRREMLGLFDGHEDLIYAAGHEQSLQYVRQRRRGRSRHYLVSGSAAAGDYVAPGLGATFATAEAGFLSLQFYADNVVWLEAWAPGEAGTRGRLLFRSRLKDPAPALSEAVDTVAAGPLPDYRDSTVTAAVNPAYARRRGLGALLLGRQHRQLWATPVRVPVLDPVRTAGGLTPLKLGGNSQSVTLWLQGGDGKTYLLRTIDKEVGRFWPPEMRRTLARSMVQEQVSMLHPFGAFLVPPLAAAAGVFHTNPRLVFVPDDPRLGPSRNAVVEQVVMIEERPDEDMSDVASMGHARNVIGTTKLFREVDGDNDHRVGARAFARARLLDMLIADHDRTTDNWRWAAFEPYELNPDLEGEARQQGKIYLPVPRDRDMAFLKVDGLLPTLYRLLAEPTWQDFDQHYGFIRGLNKKGLPLDRRFTASLTRRDWVEIADSIRSALTEDVIEAAVRSWPAPVVARNGAATIARLQARRDRLPVVADRYYDVLARVVDVVGSHKHERFEVTRRADGQTEVVVFKTSREGEIRRAHFRRTFSPQETKELRLYGFGGNDRFIVRGDAGSGIRVIAVGGPGDDAFVDSSSVRGWRRRTRVYDTPTGTRLDVGGETKVILRDDPRVNHYDIEGFTYDLARPVGAFSSDRDDGLVLSAGAEITRHGFRKTPYARRHTIAARVTTLSRAAGLRYAGHYVSVAGTWDLRLDAALLNANHIHNFYGLGNETPADRDAAGFYRARFARALLKPSLARTLDSGVHLSIGPTIVYTDVRETEHRAGGTVPSAAVPGLRGAYLFAGVAAGLRVDATDYGVNPKQGFRLQGSVDVNTDLEHGYATYATLASSLALYASPSLDPQVTLAARAGGAHNVGTFPFFAASTLGGTQNLRGYRSTRFSGRSSLYTNVDLRVQLADFAGMFGYGEAGVLGFFDTGRVWADGERSHRWHHGYGGGLWTHLLDAVVLSGTYGLSSEDRAFTLQMGFLF